MQRIKFNHVFICNFINTQVDRFQEELSRNDLRTEENRIISHSKMINVKMINGNVDKMHKLIQLICSEDAKLIINA